jgi:hypothetical protein
VLDPAHLPEALATPAGSLLDGLWERRWTWGRHSSWYRDDIRGTKASGERSCRRIQGQKVPPLKSLRSGCVLTGERPLLCVANPAWRGESCGGGAICELAMAAGARKLRSKMITKDVYGPAYRELIKADNRCSRSQMWETAELGPDAMSRPGVGKVDRVVVSTRRTMNVWQGKPAMWGTGSSATAREHLAVEGVCTSHSHSSLSNWRGIGRFLHVASSLTAQFY